MVFGDKNKNKIKSLFDEEGRQLLSLAYSFASPKNTLEGNDYFFVSLYAIVNIFTESGGGGKYMCVMMVVPWGQRKRMGWLQVGYFSFLYNKMYLH